MKIDTGELDRLLPVKMLINIKNLTLPQASKMLGFTDVSALRYALFDTNDLDLSVVLDFAKMLGYELEYKIYGGVITNPNPKVDTSMRLGFLRYAMEERGFNEALLAYYLKRKELSVQYILNKDDMKMSYFYKILAAMGCSLEINLRQAKDNKVMRNRVYAVPCRQTFNFSYSEDASFESVDFDISKKEFVERRVKSRRAAKAGKDSESK